MVIFPPLSCWKVIWKFTFLMPTGLAYTIQENSSHSNENSDTYEHLCWTAPKKRTTSRMTLCTWRMLNVEGGAKIAVEMSGDTELPDISSRFTRPRVVLLHWLLPWQAGRQADRHCARGECWKNYQVPNRHCALGQKSWKTAKSQNDIVHVENDEKWQSPRSTLCTWTKILKNG